MTVVDGPARRSDLIRLHAIILVWGFTAVLGRWITLPAIEIVLVRCSMAAAALAIWLTVIGRRSGSATRSHQSTLLVRMQWWAIGSIIAAHWVTFFASIKLAGVSPAMIGLATLSLWTAFLEPMLVSGRRYHREQFAFAAVIFGAVVLIYGGQGAQSATGFLVAIVSAFLAAIFSVLNARYTPHYDAKFITMHQMAGAAATAAVLCGTAEVTSNHAGWLIEPGQRLQLPSGSQWLALSALSLICTVYAYVEFVELLSRLKVFTVIFANNLEPVYGIALAALFFGEHEQLTSRFFVGAAVILLAVMMQTYVAIRRRSAGARSKGDRSKGGRSGLLASGESGCQTGPTSIEGIPSTAKSTVRR